MKLSPNHQRITSIDAFRGFALGGIVLVHIVEQYVAGPLPPDALPANGDGIVNGIVNAITFLFIRGKFFALFSLLFGLSFYLQVDRSAAKSDNFMGRFAWRLIILFFIGYLHHLFYRGDILTIYAPLGFILLFSYRLSNKAILIIAGLIFLGLPRFLVYGLHGPGGFISPDYVNSLEGASPEAYYEIITQGSLLEVFRANGGAGMLNKMEFQVGIISRAYLTVAFFLVGMWMGRIKLFERVESYLPELKKALWFSIAGLVIFFVITGGLFYLIQDNPENSWVGMIGLTTFDLHNLSMTALLLIGFLLIYRRPGGQRSLSRLAPYGRMALTNYFMQSVIGTFLLFGWGLGLLGKLNNGWLLLIGLLILAGQAALSTWWLQHFRYGPLEWLWRSLTYLKWQPFRKPAQPLTADVQ